MKDNPDAVQVVIRSKLSDYSFDLEVPCNMPVSALKMRAAELLGIDLFDQTLGDTTLALRHARTGNRLHDERTVGSYDIQNEDVIELYKESVAGLSPQIQS